MKRWTWCEGEGDPDDDGDWILTESPEEMESIINSQAAIARKDAALRELADAAEDLNHTRPESPATMIAAWNRVFAAIDAARKEAGT